MPPHWFFDFSGGESLNGVRLTNDCDFWCPASQKARALRIMTSSNPSNVGYWLSPAVHSGLSGTRHYVKNPVDGVCKPGAWGATNSHRGLRDRVSFRARFGRRSMTFECAPPGDGYFLGYVANAPATRNWTSLVRSRVGWADRDADAQALAGQVVVDAGSGQVAARGPNSADHEGWAVSYELFVPQTSDLKLTAKNGAVTVSDVRSLERASV